MNKLHRRAVQTGIPTLRGGTRIKIGFFFWGLKIRFFEKIGFFWGLKIRFFEKRGLKIRFF
jgi:hypothetical protein